MGCRGGNKGFQTPELVRTCPIEMLRIPRRFDYWGRQRHRRVSVCRYDPTNAAALPTVRGIGVSQRHPVFQLWQREYFAGDVLNHGGKAEMIATTLNPNALFG